MSSTLGVVGAPTLDSIAISYRLLSSPLESGAVRVGLGFGGLPNGTELYVDWNANDPFGTPLPPVTYTRSALTLGASFDYSAIIPLGALQPLLHTIELGLIGGVMPPSTQFLFMTGLGLTAPVFHAPLTPVGLPAVFIGSRVADVLVGGAQADSIEGMSGDDFLGGGGGNDVLRGGNGQDMLVGGFGNDFLAGEDGHDTLRGQEGEDSLRGAEGDDRLFGGAGNDNLTGSVGNDLLKGQDGDDKLEDNLGDSTMFGGAGNDELNSAGGTDMLFGDSGADTLWDAEGNDSLAGGSGNDVLRGLDAGLGDGTPDNNLMRGQDGDDRIFGSDGRDTLIGGSGRDSLIGGAGRDRLIGGGGNDSLLGGAGNDTMIEDSEPGQDDFTGGAGNDLIRSADDNLRDRFFFDLVGDGTDTITNFETGVDEIRLRSSGGFANDSILVLGFDLLQAVPTLIFDPLTARLLYDADGSGGGAAVAIAVLPGVTMLTFNDDILVL